MEAERPEPEESWQNRQFDNLSENDRSDFIYAIGQAQKEAYNEAINEAANVALCEREGYGYGHLTGSVSKASILKLLK